MGQVAGRGKIVPPRSVYVAVQRQCRRRRRFIVPSWQRLLRASAPFFDVDYVRAVPWLLNINAARQKPYRILKIDFGQWLPLGHRVVGERQEVLDVRYRGKCVRRAMYPRPQHEGELRVTDAGLVDAVGTAVVAFEFIKRHDHVQFSNDEQMASRVPHVFGDER